MSVLESFFFVFEADASRLRAGVADATATSDGLERSLQATDATADKLGDNFNKMAGAAKGALTSIISLVAIKALTKDTSDNTYAVYQQAHAMGVSVESLSKWQQAVKMSGGSADGATSSMESLRAKFVEMSRYGGVQNADSFMFSKMGMSAQQMHDSIKDPMIAMNALADKFGTLDRTGALFLGKQLGFDQGTINLLSQGRRGLDEIMKKQTELGFITREQAANTVKYKLATIELGVAFESLSREMVTAMLPALQWVMDKSEKLFHFLIDHKQETIAVFEGIAVAAGLMAISFGAAALPFLLMSVAIGLVIDDFQAYKAGQDSVIGEAMAKWPILGQVIRSTGQIIEMALNGGITKAFDMMREHGIAALDELIQKYPGIGRLGDALVITFGKPLEMVEQTLERVINLMIKLFNLPSKIGAKLLDFIGNSMASATGGHYDGINTPVAPGQASAKGSEIAKKLEEMGWSPEHAAGIAGSLMQESGGNPAAVNPKSGAYGVGQWLGSRVNDYKAWSGGQDLNGSSLDDQLRFMTYEMREGNEKSAGMALLATKTAADAAAIHGNLYERAGAEEMNTGNRISYANAIMAGSNMTRGQLQLDSISASPISNITGGSNSNRSVSVQTGDIHVHTQATDADGISAILKSTLEHHIRNATDQYDDGVLG